jgi:predicted hydrolase (HD superfamily)
MTRDKALKVLKDLKNSPNMQKHALAVGFAMASLYDHLKENNKKSELTRNDWEIVGLLHDADYEITEKSLDRHTDETTKKLKEINANDIIIAAIRGHCDKAERKTLMAKAVYAVDELTGFIVACALVQPDKKLKSVKLESVFKKIKDKSFAAAVNRNQINTCQKELNIALNEFIEITLKSMQEKSEELGL